MSANFVKSKSKFMSKIKSKPFFVFIFLFALFIVGVSFYLYQKNVANKKPNFISQVVRKGNISHTVNATGMIYPKKILKVGAQVSGEISELAVSIGDKLKKGDLIAKIDASTQENAKLSAQAQLNSQEARLKSAKSNLEKAQSAFNRADKLYQQGAISQADYESSKVALSSAKNSVVEINQLIVQNKLSVKNAELSLSYTSVLAPMDGTVIAISVEEGQTLSSAQSAPTIITLAQTDIMTIKAEIAEADVGLMRPNLPVSLTLLGGQSQVFKSFLKSVDPAPKEISENSNLSNNSPIYYYGHIDVENVENKLRYGMTANIKIQVDKADAVLLIPMAAINKTPKGSSVLLLKNGETITQPIKVGLQDGVSAQVLEGLSEGDEIIVSSATNVKSLGRAPRGGAF